MKKAAMIVASVAAAAASVALGLKSDHRLVLPSASNEASERKEGGCGLRRVGGESEKFAPRFDGLRFIETLVTAHR